MATETHPLIVETRLPLWPGSEQAEAHWDFLGRATVLVATADGGAVAAGDHGVVWRIRPDGVVVPLAGDTAHAWADDRRTVDPDGVGLVGVVTDAVVMPDGAALLAEPYRCRICRLAPDGTLTTFASWDPRDPLLGTGQHAFPGPCALAVDGEGRLYAMLGYRRRILALAPLGGPGTVVTEDPPGGAFDIDDPKAFRRWPSFAALPGGGFLVADPAIGAVHVLDGQGREAVVRFQSGFDPLGARGRWSGTESIAVTPDGSWLAQFQDQLGLVTSDGRFGPIIGGGVHGMPWAVVPSGGVMRLVEDALLRYVVPTSQLAHELAGAHGFIAHDPEVSVSTLAGGRPGSQDGALGDAEFHHPAALAPWGPGFVVLEAGAWRLRGAADGRVETLADWTATPGVRLFDYADHGVAVDETGAIWVRGLSWRRLLGVDALGHLLDGPPDRSDGALVEEAGTYTLRPTHDETERYEARRLATWRDPNPVRERWAVQSEMIKGLGGLLASTERDHKGRHSWPLIATEPDGTAWVGGRTAAVARVEHAAFATLPGLVHPIGRAVRVGDDLFVLDPWEPRVLRLDRNGTVSRYAGGLRGFRDGPALQAGFRNLVAIVADRDGGLLVIDEDNHAIRRISPDGLVSTVAGTGEAGFVDGPGGEARFFEPSGLVLTAEGHLVVADKRNHALRLVRRGGPANTQRVEHAFPSILVMPDALIGRRLDAVLVRSDGLVLELEGARACFVLDDENGIIELEGEGTERHEDASVLNPASAIGARVVALDVDLEVDRLPVVRALRFENGINLRVAADVGRVVLLPDRWNAATWRPRPLPGAASIAWHAFAGRTVLEVKATLAGVDLQLDDGRRATITPPTTPIPARSMWGERIAPVGPQPWDCLAGRKIRMVGLRYETSGGREPTEVVFYGEAEKEDAAFAARGGMRLTIG